MAVNYGKKFEQKFKEDFLKSLPNSTIDRLYDVTMGYKAISQISDYIGYRFPNIFYLEIKTHKGASIPIDNITQYEKLICKIGIPGVRVGVILWLYEKDIVMYIPASTIMTMIEDGKKSIGIRAIDEGYNIKIIPSVKRRTYMDSDYSILMNLNEGE